MRDWIAMATEQETRALERELSDSDTEEDEEIPQASGSQLKT